MQNGFVDSFNGRLRDECLYEHLYRNLNEARQIIEDWRIDYNTADRTRASIPTTALERIAFGRFLVCQRSPAVFWI
jgi:transposase InsO family protein